MNRTITNTAADGALGRLSHRLRTQATSLIRAGSALARRKTIRVLGLMGSIAATSVLIAAPAGATIQRSNSAPYPNKNCTVSVYLDQYGNTFSAGGQVPCSTRYDETGVYVYLEWYNRSLGRWITAQDATTFFSHSYGTGSHTLWTTPRTTQTAQGCYYWRAAVQAQINNDQPMQLLFTAPQEHCQ